MGLSILLSMLSLVDPQTVALADEGQVSDDKRCYILAYDTSIGSSITPFSNFFQLLYERAGYCVRSIGMTPKRSEHLLRVGQIDGDWSRVEGYAAYMQGAVFALPQPIFEMAANFVWLDNSDFDGDPQNLKGRTVGYHAGFRWLEWNLPKHGATIMPLPNETHIFDLLARGRIDLYATGAVNVQEYGARTASSPGGKPPVFRQAKWRPVPFHHIVAAHNADIVGSLNAVLVDLIDSGMAARIIQVPGINVAERR